MNFTSAVKTVFRKAFDFQGRAMRSEFWYFVLFQFLVGIIAGALDAALFKELALEGNGPIGLTMTLVLFIPGLSVSFRRLHDIDRSAWWLLIGLVPLIGLIVLIYFFVQPGTPGQNRFGAYPDEYTNPNTQVL